MFTISNFSPARWLARGVLGLSALWVAAMPARAGLVTGNWDPAFGSFLPDLGWQVRAEFLIPDACSSQGNGIFNTSNSPDDPCYRGNIVVQHVWLRLFNISTASLNDFFTNVSGVSLTVDVQAAAAAAATADGYGISQVRVDEGQVTGITAGRASTLYELGVVSSPVLLPFASPASPSSAQGNTFGLTFGTNGPQLFCYICTNSDMSPYEEPGTLNSSTDGLQQYLVTYTSDDTSTPKATDANGKALGAALNATGQFLGLRTADQAFTATVPEPSALALAGLALFAAAAARSRRA